MNDPCPSKNYTPNQIEKISQNCETGKKTFIQMLAALHPDKNKSCAEDANHKFQEAGAICEAARENKIGKYREQERVIKTAEDPRKKLLEEHWARAEKAKKTKKPSPKKPSPKKPSPKKTSPKKPKIPSPKSKRAPLPEMQCMALEYSEEQIINIARNGKNDPYSFEVLINNLSPQNNGDCPDLAAELLQLATEVYNQSFPSYQIYDGEFDSKMADYFSNTAETVQVGSSHQGSNYIVLSLDEKIIAIISYTVIEPQIIEIGKAWYRKIDDFQKLFSYLLETKSSTDFGGRPLSVKPYVNASLFSNFQIKFWMKEMEMKHLYFTENALYLTNGSPHSIDSVNSIKDQFVYYSNVTLTKYIVPEHVITYLYNWVIKPKLTISSLILTNTKFFTKPPVEEIDSALKYKNISAVFFQIPVNYLGFRIHAIPFPKLCKFLFSRLDFHFVGSIAREGTYIYYFPIRIRILLKHLEQNQLLDIFEAQFINAMKKLTILNDTDADNLSEVGQGIVNYINEKVTLGLVTEVNSDLKNYIENITSLNQPVLRVILFNPNTEISIDSPPSFVR